MDLVTVIIPIYNTENYLRECINSIINQSYRPIQLILVDDGSKDGSLAICRECAQKHSWIEVYHQENQGVSVARNTGLEHTKGKWVFFVDSDDFVAPEYIQHFMEMGDYPFIAGGYTENTPARWQYKVPHCVVSMEDYKNNPRENLVKIPSVHVSGCRYLYSVIADNGIVFDRGIVCGEDLRFNVKYFSCIDQLCASEHCEYFYTMREGSAIHTFWPNRLEEERSEAQARESLFGGSSEFDYVKYIHWHTTLEHLYLFSAKSQPQRKVAAKKLKEAIKDPYFRTALPWMTANGTLDMKIEAWCLRLGSYKLYKFALVCLSKAVKLLRR